MKLRGRATFGAIPMIDQLIAIATRRVLTKRSLLIQRGDTKGSLFFIQEGLVKTYYETEDGKEFVKSFIAGGDFIACMQSVISKSPSTFSAICLKDCTIFEITRTALYQALDTDTQFVKMLNALLIKVAAKKEQREYELLCLSAEQRYRAFCEREPILAENLSQKDIAHYLGISPVSLCRIRHAASKNA